MKLTDKEWDWLIELVEYTELAWNELPDGSHAYDDPKEPARRRSVLTKLKHERAQGKRNRWINFPPGTSEVVMGGHTVAVVTVAPQMRFKAKATLPPQPQPRTETEAPDVQ